MEKEKRKPRSYKIADKPYYRALRRGFKDKPLASILEEVAKAYGKGYAILYETTDRNLQVIVDQKK